MGQNMTRRGLHAQVLHGAVSTSDGSATMRLNLDDSLSSSLAVYHASSGSSQPRARTSSVTVPTHDFGRLISELVERARPRTMLAHRAIAGAKQRQALLAMKLDVEGAEDDLLQHLGDHYAAALCATDLPVYCIYRTVDLRRSILETVA